MTQEARLSKVLVVFVQSGSLNRDVKVRADGEFDRKIKRSN